MKQSAMTHQKEVGPTYTDISKKRARRSTATHFDVSLLLRRRWQLLPEQMSCLQLQLLRQWTSFQCLERQQQSRHRWMGHLYQCSMPLWPKERMQTNRGTALDSYL
jgi:hypothetical protein